MDSFTFLTLSTLFLKNAFLFTEDLVFSTLFTDFFSPNRILERWLGNVGEKPDMFFDS